MSANPVILSLLAFALVFLIVLALAIAFGVFDSTRRTLHRRLDKIRERYSSDRSVAARARARRIRTGDEPRSALDAALRSLVPRPEELRRRLSATGRPITIGQYAATGLIIAAVTVLVFLAVLGLPLALSILVGIVVGVGLPHFVVGRLIASRIKKFTQQFPDAIDLIVRGLKSGLPVNQSIAAVSREFADPVGAEFRHVTDKVKLGKTMESALWDMAQRIDTPDFKFFVITLAIQRETGGNLAETLGNLSDILRKRQQLKLKIKAMSSEAKASAYIVGALPFIMFGMLLMLNYGYASMMFTDSRAMIAGIGGLVWMGVGVAIMAKMINFEV
ncbi:MAG: pilus assembly protein TadB [Alphaproteobacteria bacterium]|nr:MAG: pilus assembly protein TadB [Alphaproteobacteria bacterium]